MLLAFGGAGAATLSVVILRVRVRRQAKQRTGTQDRSDDDATSPVVCWRPSDIPSVGLGGASLGDLYVRLSNSKALATVDAAFEHGVRLFDTAPWYGLGLSEAS